MPDYREVQNTVKLPTGIGLDGYLAAIRKVLLRPRVQSVLLELGGKVTYKRFVLPDEPEDEVGLVLEGLGPYTVIRGLPVAELSLRPGMSAAVAVAMLFSLAATDGLNPVAFIGGFGGAFRNWHAKSTGHRLVGDDVYGLPFLTDSEIPDESFILCAAYSKTAALSDVKKSYKITIPHQGAVP